MRMALIAAAAVAMMTACNCEKKDTGVMKETTIETIAEENVFDLVGKQWMLITAGTKDSFNTMTASWGGLGILWNKNVATIYVRPSRYTHDFIENNGTLTLSFFPEECRKALQICGSRSGRDCDKVAEAGLTPVELEGGDMTFAEARLVLQCRKLFKTEMSEDNFIDKETFGKWYGADEGAPHTIYILEIEKVFSK